MNTFVHQCIYKYKFWQVLSECKQCIIVETDREYLVVVGKWKLQWGGDISDVIEKIRQENEGKWECRQEAGVALLKASL